MTLRERHKDKSNFELVSMIENHENYTQKCIFVLNELLNERTIEAETFREIVLKVNTEKIRYKLVNFDPIYDEVEIHKSNYLSKEEIKEIYIQQMDVLVKDREDFRFDVWLYSIGGL